MLDKTTTQVETRFLPDLAAAIASWFPDLGGRSLAVSNVEVTKANVPTLPLVMVAFARSESTQPSRSGHPDEYTITDFVVIEFWLEPDQYRRADGTATPFWSYYPYEEIRDRLLTYLARWNGPHEERLAYRSLGINADQFAVTLTFGFEVRFQWCPTVKEQGEAFTPYFRLCAPVTVECLPDSYFKQPALP